MDVLTMHWKLVGCDRLLPSTKVVELGIIHILAPISWIMTKALKSAQDTVINGEQKVLCKKKEDILIDPSVGIGVRASKTIERRNSGLVLFAIWSTCAIGMGTSSFH